jgi:hypothetical protein
MTTPCKYCWNPLGKHNEGCPTLNPDNLKRWEKGRSYGFLDNTIHYWNYKYYSKSFILGYRVGKQEIDTLVDEAAQENYSP